MTITPGRGPAWLGIGAMRSGTTFLANCLRQHSQVGFGRNGQKEARGLHRLESNERQARAYLRQFDDPHVLRGDFTVRYLWLQQAAYQAAKVMEKSAPIIVVLRDPIERFESHQRLAQWKRDRGAWEPIWQPLMAQVVGQHTGNYADHLRMWARHVDEQQLRIFTYEEVTRDVATVCEAIWSALELEPEPFNPFKAARYPTPEEATWAWPAGMRQSLADHYEKQVIDVRDDWGVDVEPWLRKWHLAAT